MKKLFTLILISLTAFSFNATAQATGCNANFYFQYISNSTVKFNPVPNSDSQYIHHSWNFGDGTAINYQPSPTHTFASAGTYSVQHIVTKINANGVQVCTDTVTKNVVITPDCNLVADFSWSATANNALSIQFTNLSTPLTSGDSTIWYFGDNTSSFDVNPLHTYANYGTYNVCLKVKQNNNPPGTTPCLKYICKTVIVTACDLHADFTWRTDSVNAQKIWFTNTSTPVNTSDSVRWTFGDGTSSHLYSPDHTYAQSGTYNVCLRMQKRDPAGIPTNCYSEICKTIVVQSTCNFQANFSWKVDSLNHKKIDFTNLTVPPTASATAIWFFGDGTSATSWNAVHEYANTGRYYVCLRVQLTPTCVRYKCDSITIYLPPPPCNDQSNFTFVKAATNSQSFTFTPDYQTNAAQYTWTFGDGTGSHDMIATHHYAHAGTYTTCLTVWRSATCASTSCKTVNVTMQIDCDSVHVYYSYQRDQYIPNKIYFYAHSNYPILDQTWTITRLPNTNPPVILHQNNPVYVFTDTGYYNVCLKILSLGGCVKEYCSTIHIEHVASQCQLQAYPNPATTSVSVNVSLSQPEMIHVYVFNTLNVLVKEKQQQGVTGNNVVTLNITDLVNGYYTMKVIYGDHNCNSAFQKL